MKTVLIGVVMAALLAGCGEARNRKADEGGEAPMTEAELRAKLTPEQYRIAFEGGTERAFTGKYWDTKTPGTYRCAVCGQELFTSGTKYDSGCGWPSFYAPIDEGAVSEREDRTHGMVRTEVVCSKCGAHLGHVFPDGPQPTGERYCMNSAVLDLVPENDPK